LAQNVLQLAQLKRDVKSGLEALTNYTCLETLAQAKRMSATPVRRFVRVEMAVVNNRELYSWPDSTSSGIESWWTWSAVA
jgi:hypothetical protein